MIFRFVIVTAFERPDELAFARLIKIEEPGDIERGVHEAVAEWRRMFPERDLLKERCTLVIEPESNVPGDSNC